MHKKQPIKDLAYYLTLFKLEGHETWRADLKNEKDGFDKAQAHNLASGAKNMAKIIEKVVIRIDRLTGTLAPTE